MPVCKMKDDTNFLCHLEDRFLVVLCMYSDDCFTVLIMFMMKCIIIASYCCDPFFLDFNAPVAALGDMDLRIIYLFS